MNILNKIKLKKKSKVINICLVISLILSIVFVSSNYIISYASTLTDYQQQLKKIKEEQQKNAQTLQGIEKEIAQDTLEIIDLDSKVSEISFKLDDLEKKVSDVNTKIANQEQLLQKASQEYNSAEDIYATRLRLIYENGVPSVVDVLFSSKSISEFFSKLNVVTSILSYDKSLVGNMQSQKEYVDYIKKDIEVQKIQLEQLKYDTEKSSEALESARNAKESKMKELEANKTNIAERNKILAKQEEEANKKIAEELAKIQYSNSAFGGKFAWPVPGYYNITAIFKDSSYNVYGMTNHSGTDVASSGIRGKTICAMESGKVIVASYMQSGYGNYVIIDHGKGSDGINYRTLYGHGEVLLVSAGQTVVRGQPIAKVGTTGWSTGPHLHVEVRKNNVAVDTMQYFKGIGINFTYQGRAYPFK